MPHDNLPDALAAAVQRRSRVNVNRQDSSTDDRVRQPVVAAPTYRCSPPLRDVVRAGIEGVDMTCHEHAPPPSTDPAPIALNDDDALTALILGATGVRTTNP